ncbi:hypothetical protein O3P69_010178 [Scylla paramamosain]|uniref:Uncharacterized protein n=1 Tax=Scylla paramamosain TaxID=85552 RepID=A0AAW0TUT2_SCYPA
MAAEIVSLSTAQHVRVAFARRDLDSVYRAPFPKWTATPHGRVKSVNRHVLAKDVKRWETCQQRLKEPDKCLFTSAVAFVGYRTKAVNASFNGSGDLMRMRRYTSPSSNREYCKTLAFSEVLSGPSSSGGPNYFTIMFSKVAKKDDDALQYLSTEQIQELVYCLNKRKENVPTEGNLKMNVNIKKKNLELLEAKKEGRRCRRLGSGWRQQRPVALDNRLRQRWYRRLWFGR